MIPVMQLTDNVKVHNKWIFKFCSLGKDRWIFIGMSQTIGDSGNTHARQ